MNIYGLDAVFVQEGKPEMKVCVKLACFVLLPVLTAAHLVVFSRASANVLSLEECIAIAQSNNPEIAVAGENYKKAESALLSNYGRVLPNFSLGFYTGHRFYGPSSIQFDASGRPVIRDGFDYPDFTFNMSSQIQIYDGGESINMIKAARSNREAARENLRYRRSYIEARVIRAYYDVVRYSMLLSAARESETQALRNLERTEALMEVGSATKADVLKARVRYSNTKLSVIDSRNALELAREELNTLLRFEGDRAIEVDTTIVLEFEEPDAETEIAYALKHRPDLRSLVYGMEAAEANLAAAKSGWLPRLGASFNYNWNDRKMAKNLNFFDEEYAWGVTAYVSIDLFDRFLTASNVRNASAERRIAAYNYEKMKLEAEKEIRQLVLAMTRNREKIAVATEAVEQASEDLKLAEERYRVGAGTMLETIDAQAALMQAKADVIQAKCDYLVAKADLDVATGRGIRH